METATAPSLSHPLRLRLPIAGAAAVLALLAVGHQAHAAALHRAALVIEHGSGRLVTRCVSFVEAQISGMQLIQRAGIQYQAQQFGSLGSAVCQLDDEPGQPPANCFGSGPYWQYFHRTGNGWAQSASGATTWMVRDGDTDGWHYAAGADQTPANMSFAAVCRPAAPTQSSVPSRSAAAPAARTATAPPSAAAAPATTPTTAASIVALAPTISSTSRASLAETGPAKAAPAGRPDRVWLFLGGATVLLVGLVGINLRRRGP